MAETIKEFLVSLGYEFKGRQNFIDDIGNITKSVVKLAAGIATTEVAFVAAVGNMADELEKLYFMSERTGATAAGIQQLGYSYRSVGYGADLAKASVESLASSIRHSPGIRSLIEGLGVDTNQPTEKMAKDLGKVFREMPTYQALAYAQTLGLNEQQVLALKQSTDVYDKWYGAAMKRFKYNTDEATSSAHGFMEELRRLGVIGEILAGKEGGILSEKLAPVLERINQYLLENADGLDRAVNVTGESAVDIFESLAIVGETWVDILKDVYVWYLKLDPETQNMIKLSAGLLIGLELVAKTGWLGIATAAALVYEDYKTYKEGGDALIPWADWEDELKAVAEAWKSIKDAAQDTYNWTRDHTTDLLTALDPQNLKTPTTPTNDPGPNVGKTEWEQGKARRAYVIKTLQDYGGMSEDTAIRITAGLMTESGLNPKAWNQNENAQGIAQWSKGADPTRFERIKDYLGTEPKDATLEDQIRAVIHELSWYEQGASKMILQGDTGQGAANFSRFYERPRDPATWEMAREYANHIKQDIQININGNVDKGVLDHAGSVIGDAAKDGAMRAVGEAAR